MSIKQPYPWFGGKARVASLVWERLGADVRNYVEPFFGGGGVLLNRPWPHGGIETINDADRFVANFWRATQADPEAVANWCDWPVNEADLHARHSWLVNHTADFRERMHADPDYFDAKIAGWWVWGLCQWIGGGWCAKARSQRPHLGDAGCGVNRKSQDAPPNIRRPALKASMGVHRKSQTDSLLDYFGVLKDRMRRVRVCCGDWSRVLGKTPTTANGVTAVVLDPPYGGGSNRDLSIYAHEDHTVAGDVLAWCLGHGGDPKLRIALCGYEGEHEALEAVGWSAVAWKTQGGMGNRGEGRGRANRHRERIWFSPHCLPVAPADATPLLREAASC